MSHLSFEIIRNNAFSADQKAFKLVDGSHHEPYTNTAEVLSMIKSGQRHEGQVFKVFNSDHSDIDTWHFFGGIADENLVIKDVDTNMMNTDLQGGEENRYHNMAGFDWNLVCKNFNITNGNTTMLSLGNFEASPYTAFVLQAKQDDDIHTLIFGPDSTKKYLALGAESVENHNRNELRMQTDKVILQNVDNNNPIGANHLLAFLMVNLPVYDSEAAAVTAGLATDQVYKTSTGELRIKL